MQEWQHFASCSFSGMFSGAAPPELKQISFRAARRHGAIAAPDGAIAPFDGETLPFDGGTVFGAARRQVQFHCQTLQFHRVSLPNGTIAP